MRNGCTISAVAVHHGVRFHRTIGTEYSTGSMVSAMIISDMLCGEKNEYADIFSPSRRILHPQLALNAAESVTNLVLPSRKRCPHLGCALKWNKAEHSWDCPCHGSRFAENGRVLDNPANGDI